MQFSQDFKTEKAVSCFHCGEICPNLEISIDDKFFCCNGCKLVFEILEENKLCKYYELDKEAGVSLKNSPAEFGSRFAFLDDDLIKKKLIDFTNGEITTVTFFTPQIHCSACIWLLENLHKLNKGISFSRVDFLKKKVSIKFSEQKTSLRAIFELLSRLGYEPKISLDDMDIKKLPDSSKKLYYKIGIAGFCFANIMLLSFPEYLSLGKLLDITYKQFFGYLNLFLSLPVILYSSSDYFRSAIIGMRQKKINIDFPISLGLLALFLRSVYEVVSQTGPGFFDSMTGLVFFLLIGKIFQSKTFDVLNFERNYKSYFPISVTLKKSGISSSKPVSKLEVGDRIIVRNNELIPADSILFNGTGNIDYSFVTGESFPEEKVMGQVIYAGGRQVGGAIELEVVRTVTQSYLTQLWNNDVFLKKDEDKFDSMVNTVGKYFAGITILIAVLSVIVWFPVSISKAIFVFTSILIVACPCGLALTSPFALGNAMRILGRNKFYVKNTSVIERMSKIDSVVFDKTGTITKQGNAMVSFIGGVLSSFEQQLVKSVVRNSSHPLSAMIFDAIKEEKVFEVQDFKEWSGKGIEANVGIYSVKMGEKFFVTGEKAIHRGGKDIVLDTKVYLSINGENKGYFSISNIYRENIEEVIYNLNKEYELSLLSGDNNGEKWNLLKYFDNPSQLYFNQSPLDKLYFINKLQSSNKKVMMIGDGLNDAGALKQSDVGVAISENLNNFTPSCDVIADASCFNFLDRFLKYSKTTKTIIILGFIISLIYNVFGISLAFMGMVSPILAAILMPISSVTVVLFTILGTNLMAKKRGLV